VHDAPAPPDDLDDHKVRATPLRNLVRLVVGIAVLGSFGVWLYALSGVARQPPPDELDSTRALIEATEAGETYEEFDGEPAYAKRAEVICEDTIGALPDASEAMSGIERAEQLRTGNVQLREMITQLRDLPVASERDDLLRNLFLDDWTVLVGDRDRYAAAVEVDPGAIFTVSAVADNERLERRLTRFARTNLMLACGAPTDVG